MLTDRLIPAEQQTSVGTSALNNAATESAARRSSHAGLSLGDRFLRDEIRRRLQRMEIDRPRPACRGHETKTANRPGGEKSMRHVRLP